MGESAGRIKTKSVSHTGGSLGFSSYMVFYPDLNSGIVLLSNEADQGTQSELIAALAGKIIASCDN